MNVVRMTMFIGTQAHRMVNRGFYLGIKRFNLYFKSKSYCGSAKTPIH
jgi:hypothetical protein